ncbi:MAG TPA: LuxR C-terminal-related transcriptional regulator, partial [Candidatus Tectomicrobia bacterium]
GIVLYEMLTGEHPFPNLTPVERLFKHLNDPVPVITAFEPDVSKAINVVIQRATAKNPEHRFLDVRAFAVTFREAAGLTVSQAARSLVELLTPREQEVLKLILDGRSNREIAEQLVIELTSVKWYVNQIYRKLNVRSRVQAIVRARELNLIFEDGPRRTASTTSMTALPPPENPYRGLSAFQIADERHFFGREKLLAKLLSRLGEDGEYSRFLAIVGPSGSGKSSLVKAALVPGLWRGGLPGSERWFIVELVPGERPLDELEIALIRIAAQPSGSLMEQLQRDAHGLTRAAKLILPEDGSELVLVIDQFEELFTLVPDENVRLHFLELLHAAVTDPRSRVRVVVTLRADFYDRPLQYSNFGALVQSRTETVLPLSAEELERAIVRPAAAVGVKFEDGLVASIVQEVHYQPGALPLMQYALTELFEHREDHTLTHAGYKEIGGSVGALAKRIEEIYTELPEDGRELVRQMFLRLVTLGEGEEDTRRRVPRSELLAIGERPDLADDIIDTFTASRLLSLDNDPATRSPMVELAHEAILREWERLRGWLDESRADIRLQRALAAAGKEWRAAAKDPSYLLRGLRLVQYEQWSDQTQLALTANEREFLQVSLEEREREVTEESARQARETDLERRRSRLSRAFTSALGIGLVLAVGLAAFAFAQRQSVVRQASIGLAGQAVAELNGNTPERGVLLALEALKSYPYTPQAESALAQTVYGTHRYITMHMTDVRVSDARFSPDGTRIATVGGERIIGIFDSVTGNELDRLNDPDPSIQIEEQTGVDWSSDGKLLVTSSALLDNARVWNVEDGALLLTYEGHSEAVNRAYFNSDDRLVLTASSDGTAQLWRRDTGNTLQVFAGHEDAVRDAVWSPNEDRIATASGDGSIRIWDVVTGKELMVINAHRGGVLAVAWSPDGTLIATAGNDGLGRAWNADTGELLYSLIGHDDVVRDIEWSPDGTRLATVSRDGTARVWEAAAGGDLFTLAGGDAETKSVNWSPDGQRLVSGGGLSLRVWDATTPIMQLVGHTQSPFDATFFMTSFPAWAPDSSVILTTSPTDGTARIWDPLTGESLEVFENEPFNVDMGYTMHPSRHEILVLGPSNPQRIWNYETGEVRPYFDATFERAMGRWSPDGQLLYVMTWSGPEYAIFEAETGKEIRSAEFARCSFPAPAVWSPDSQYLAQSCFAGEIVDVVVIDALTGDTYRTLRGHTASVVGLAWSPDGMKLASASADRTARVWDLQTGEALTLFTGHTDFVFDLSWSPNGGRIVSGDVTGSVRVWEADTGEEVNNFKVAGSVTTPLWSPNGTRVLVTGVFRAPEIRPVWQSTQELIAYANNCCVFRELTPEERDQFGLPSDS